MLEVLCTTVQFEPGVLKHIMVDFEKALWKSFKEAFPGVEIVGCNFHHKQKHTEDWITRFIWA